jgi:hypothetical protein
LWMDDSGRAGWTGVEEMGVGRVDEGAVGVDAEERIRQGPRFRAHGPGTRYYPPGDLLPVEPRRRGDSEPPSREVEVTGMEPRRSTLRAPLPSRRSSTAPRRACLPLNSSPCRRSAGAMRLGNSSSRRSVAHNTAFGERRGWRSIRCRSPWWACMPPCATSLTGAGRTSVDGRWIRPKVEMD